LSAVAANGHLGRVTARARASNLLGASIIWIFDAGNTSPVNVRPARALTR
jgi:hypothetical protein